MSMNQEEGATASGYNSQSNISPVLYITGVNNQMHAETLKNLISEIAEPVTTRYTDGNHYAHVTFNSISEAEEVMKTLNRAPPHNFTIDYARTRAQGQRDVPRHEDGGRYQKRQPRFDGNTHKEEVTEKREPPVACGISGKADDDDIRFEPCLRCGKLTEFFCKDCNEFYCSTLCLKEDMVRHTSFCQKLISSRSKGISYPGRNVESMRSNLATALPYTRFLIPECSSNENSHDNSRNDLKMPKSHKENDFDQPTAWDNRSGHSKFRNNEDGRNSLNKGSSGKSYQTNRQIDNRTADGQFSRHADNWKRTQDKSNEQPTSRGKFNAQSNASPCNSDKDVPYAYNKGERPDQNSRRGIPDKGNANSRPRNDCGPDNRGDNQFRRNNLEKSNTHSKSNMNGFKDSDKSKFRGDEGRNFHRDGQNNRRGSGNAGGNQSAFQRGVKSVIPLWPEADGFWILDVKDNDLWQELHNFLKLKASELPKLDRPEVGSLCAAQFENNWFRARITTLEPLTVRFVDYGNTAPCESDLKVLPTDLELVHELVKFVKFNNAESPKLEEEVLIRNCSENGDDPLVELVRPNSFPKTPAPNHDANRPVSAVSSRDSPSVARANSKDEPSNMSAKENSNRQSMSVKENSNRQNMSVKENKASPGLADKTKDLAEVLPSIIGSLAVGDEAICGLSQVTGKKAIAIVFQSYSKVRSVLEIKCDNPTVHFSAPAGTLVVVKHENAECGWARAYIMSSCAGKDLVALVDHGLMKYVDEVFPLPEIAATPRLACVLQLDKPLLSGILECTLHIQEQHYKGWWCEVNPLDSVEAPFKALLTPWNPPDDHEKQPYITIGSQVVITSNIGLSRLYVTSADDQLIRIMEDVAAAAADAPAFKKLPAEGEVVAAKFHEDGHFYRARITRHNDCGAEVFFIDYGGHNQICQLEDLRILAKRLCDPPGAAIYVTLANVPEVACPKANSIITDAAIAKTTYEMTEKLFDGIVLKEVATGKILNEVLRDAVAVTKQKIKETDDDIIKELDKLQVRQLPTGPRVNLIVTYHNPEEFLETGQLYCWHPTDPDIAKITTELQNYCISLPNRRYRPRKQEICAVFYGDEWTRGFCVGDGDPVQIFYMDYGNTESADTSNIRQLTEEYKTLPSLATECSIRGFERFSKSARSQILQDLEKSTVISTTVSEGDSSIYVLDYPFEK